jgi:hypothetical protein
MIKIVQERTVLVEREAVVDHGVDAWLLLEGAPARVAVFDQSDEERHSRFHVRR